MYVIESSTVCYFSLTWLSAMVSADELKPYISTWNRRLKLDIRRSSADIVQLLPIKAYIILILLIYYKLIGPTPWGDAVNSMHIPRAPIPKYTGIDSKHMENNITFVTAYFYIETFFKGNFRRGMQDYLAWMGEFSKLENDLIAFTDSPVVEDMLWKARNHFPMHKTTIYLINKNDLWAFSLSGKIKKIFAQPGYPKHHPNTVIEQYPCAMHAKYELMEKVIQERMFRTKYLAWIDIGYFRIRYRKSFQLLIPPDFQDDHIAFVQMNTFEPHTAFTVISNDSVWVAGGMFIGRPEYLMVFIEDYRRLVELMITRNLMGTDQNLLYIMYTKTEHVFPRVPLQTYSAACKCDWFYLGNYCRHLYEMSRIARKRRIFGRGKLLSIYHQYL